MSFKDKLKVGWRHISLVLGLSIVGSTAYLVSSNTKTANASLINKKLCFLGDTGTGSEGQKKLVPILNSNCDRVYHTGDIIYPVGIESVNDGILFSRFINVYAPMRKDFYLTVGNHDYYGNPDEWLEVAKKFRWVHLPSLYWFQNNDGLCILGMDTNIFTGLKKKKRKEQQRRFIKNTLATEKCDLTLAIGHHPYRSCGRHGHAKGKVKDFYEDYILNKVDGVIAGHDHLLCYFNEYPFHITSGAGGKLHKKVKNNPTFGKIDYGFVQLIWKGDKNISINFFTLDGKIKEFKR